MLDEIFTLHSSLSAGHRYTSAVQSRNRIQVSEKGALTTRQHGNLTRRQPSGFAQEPLRRVQEPLRTISHR